VELQEWYNYKFSAFQNLLNTFSRVIADINQNTPELLASSDEFSSAVRRLADLGRAAVEAESTRVKLLIEALKAQFAEANKSYVYYRCALDPAFLFDLQQVTPKERKETEREPKDGEPKPSKKKSKK